MAQATVPVHGLDQEILITNELDQNRGLSGDIVAIEVHPRIKWIKNYKKVAGVDDWLAEGEDGDQTLTNQEQSGAIEGPLSL